MLKGKFGANVARVFAEKQRMRLVDACLDHTTVEAIPVHKFVSLFLTQTRARTGPGHFEAQWP